MISLAHQDNDGVLVRHSTPHTRDTPEVFLQAFYPVGRILSRDLENCNVMEVLLDGMKP